MFAMGRVVLVGDDEEKRREMWERSLNFYQVW